ncbi:hypothetical protein UXN85_20905 [Enterobacter hormaechei]
MNEIIQFKNVSPQDFSGTVSRGRRRFCTLWEVIIIRVLPNYGKALTNPQKLLFGVLVHEAIGNEGELDVDIPYILENLATDFPGIDFSDADFFHAVYNSLMASSVAKATFHSKIEILDGEECEVLNLKLEKYIEFLMEEEFNRHERKSGKKLSPKKCRKEVMRDVNDAIARKICRAY